VEVEVGDILHGMPQFREFAGLMQGDFRTSLEGLAPSKVLNACGPSIFIGDAELATAIRAFNNDGVDILGLSFNPLAGIHGG
jgi:hypothetical protein